MFTRPAHSGTALFMHTLRTYTVMLCIETGLFPVPKLTLQLSLPTFLFCCCTCSECIDIIMLGWKDICCRMFSGLYLCPCLTAVFDPRSVYPNLPSFKMYCASSLALWICMSLRSSLYFYFPPPTVFYLPYLNQTDCSLQDYFYVTLLTYWTGRIGNGKIREATRNGKCNWL